MRTLYIIFCAVLLSLSGQAVEKDFIHPLAFENVMCWWSDTEEPFVTSFSIDAVKKNRNQFNYDEVEVSDGRYLYRRGEEALGYSQSITNGKHVIKYWYNSGGTLTSRCTITGEIVVQTFEGKAVKIFKVLDFKSGWLE